MPSNEDVRMKLGSGPAKSGLHRLNEAFHRALWDRRALTRAPQYLFQCGLATLTLLIIIFVEDIVLNAAVIVAVASTAFIIFVVPNSIAATPRRVIGGHVAAIIIAGVLSFIAQLFISGPVGAEHKLFYDVIAALSLGFSILLMVVTNTEHPPAAGTAMGLIIHGFTWDLVFFVIMSALLLTFVRLILRPRLTNLL